MSKLTIGLIFILVGLCYGSLVFDDIYNHTLGLLIKYNWIKQPSAPGKNDLKKILGRKPTIIIYATIFIVIGLFIVWNQNK